MNLLDRGHGISDYKPISAEQSEQWLLEHFHPEGLKCPWCKSSVERANVFRVTSSSELKVYRCKYCKSIYNLYTGTVFEQRQLRPQQGVLLIRGVLKGEPSDVLARETVLQLRRMLQENTELLQSEVILIIHNNQFAKFHLPNTDRVPRLPN